MSQIFDFFGGTTFYPGGSIYPNPKDSSLFLSLGHDVDVYFPPRKRSCTGAPFLFSGEIFKQQQPASIEVLPDECLFEVFRRLPGGEERSICACVSKCWLMLLTSIRNDEICTKKVTPSLEKTEEKPVSSKLEKPILCDKKGDGYLSRCLEGKKATDVRLASIAVGTGHRGGLGKLSIRGSHSTHGVTAVGLRAVGRCCPSLRVLSLWNVSSVGDEGLYEIANGCLSLEKLDFCKCPAISDNGLIAIAKKCPNLTSLTLESCSNIGNKSLQAIGSFCRNLTSVSIKNCPLVGDQGISSLLSSTSCLLTNLKLQGLSISNVSLAVIGYYGQNLTELVFSSLENVKERGFWVMGKGQGLQKLRSFTVTSCQGVTDLSLEAVGEGCPNLKHFCLRKCRSVSDNGLVSFSNSTISLESLQLEECHTITGYGLSHVLFFSGRKLKALSLGNCLGFQDMAFGFPSAVCCSSVRSLTIRNCPGFGNKNMNMWGKLCPHLQHLELNGLHGITDEALLPLIENSEAGLSKVNLANCVNLTDKVVAVVSKLHGVTLEQLNLEGCKKITDASLVAIADNCSFLRELDVSNCEITDSGIAALASAVQLNLLILSLSGCSSISEMSLAYLMGLGRTLLGLNIQQCNAISSRMVDFLVGCLWRCDILS